MLEMCHNVKFMQLIVGYYPNEAEVFHYEFL